jgi:hypothetical protein
MKKLNQSQLERANAVRQTIRLLSKQQDLAYSSLLSALRLVEGEDDFLFDYVFNCDGNNDTYEQFILGELYGSN